MILHITSFELTTVGVVFFAGACGGLWLAQLFIKRINRRRI
jgi:hypothetical protein